MIQSIKNDPMIIYQQVLNQRRLNQPKYPCINDLKYGRFINQAIKIKRKEVQVNG